MRLSVGEGGGSKTGFKRAVEVPLIFKAAFEGGFENALVGGAEEPCRILDPQAVDEFGEAFPAVFS